MVILAVPNLVGAVVTPALGALLIFASARTIRLRDAAFLWRAGWTETIAALTVFVGTLFLPIQWAVLLGVALSVMLNVGRYSGDISVMQLCRTPDGRIEERRPEQRLTPNEVTVLDVYGPLFFAGATTLERLLPRPAGPDHPVVVLRLRGLSAIGATLTTVLADYSKKLEEAGGRLYISGINDRVRDDIERTGRLRLAGPVRIHEATRIVGESTEEAVEDAREWLIEQGEDARDERPFE